MYSFFFLNKKFGILNCGRNRNQSKGKKVQVKIKEEEEERKKKMQLRVYELCIIFSYKKNRDIFISLCGQESSIIEQCLDAKCKVHRNPLVFS